ncbi:MAG: NAD-dependent epimerase/dehydratase family protein [Proteobacteria bacterium]|nr:NAD-dependent epimerase/dehydratase family protein [Pseudomonadota bacterium]
MTAARCIAITGLETFEGRGLAERLLEDPSSPRIVALDVRLPSELEGRVGYHPLDLSEAEAGPRLAEVLEKEGCETVVHAAFLPRPTPDRERAHELEVAGSLRVMGAVASAGVSKLVVISTAQVYGARADNPAYLSEEHPLRPPESARALRDRAQVESLLRMFSERHPQIATLSLRPCWVVGPGYESAALCHLSAPRVRLPLGFDPLVQFLHEDDWLDALVLALRRNVRGAFNLAGRGTLPLSTLLRLAGRRVRKLPHPLLSPATSLRWRGRTGEPAAAFYAYLRHGWLVDTARARAELGFRPLYSTREAWLSRFVGQRLRKYA